MRVLVVYGTKMGGTAELAEWIAETLREEACEVVVSPAADIRDLTGYDAVIVGGSLYSLRWHRDARQFVRRHRQALSTLPVWLFSSGPLDDSASDGDIPPVRAVRAALDRIGARGHATFGGRLPTDATGFPAASMARDRAGDWRDPTRVAAWAREIAATLRQGVVTAD